jgi:AraC family transcriptional regulator
MAVVLEGRVRKRFGAGYEDVSDGTLVVMPHEERHEDLFGREGARIVVVETDVDVGRVACFRDWSATLIAVRIARELAAPDVFTPLALEGLSLELSAVAARGATVRSTGRRNERWLEEVRAVLVERFRDPPTAAELADVVGVHPSHLARVFRSRYGDSLGGYARRLRLEWAADRLARSDQALVCLARDAGFVDQSHFTHAFRREFGLTPARYRRLHR